MPQEWFDKKAEASLYSAVKKLNFIYPKAASQKSLDEYVEFRIFDPMNRGLLYKINGDLPNEIKEAIRDAIIKQAKKLRIEVITKG